MGFAAAFGAPAPTPTASPAPTGFAAAFGSSGSPKTNVAQQRQSTAALTQASQAHAAYANSFIGKASNFGQALLDQSKSQIADVGAQGIKSGLDRSEQGAETLINPKNNFATRAGGAYNLGAGALGTILAPASALFATPINEATDAITNNKTFQNLSSKLPNLPYGPASQVAGDVANIAGLGAGIGETGKPEAPEAATPTTLPVESTGTERQVPIQRPTVEKPQPAPFKAINLPKASYEDYLHSMGYEPNYATHADLPTIEAGSRASTPKAPAIENITTPKLPRVEKLNAPKQFENLSLEDKQTVLKNTRSLFGKGMTWQGARDTALARFNSKLPEGEFSVHPIEEPKAPTSVRPAARATTNARVATPTGAKVKGGFLDTFQTPETAKPVESAPTVRPTAERPISTVAEGVTPTVQGESTATPSEPGVGKLPTVEGTGKIVPNKVSSNIEKDAIVKGLTDSYSGQPTHATFDFGAQAERVVQMMDTDPERATRIAMGDEPAPLGDIPSAYHTGVIKRALENGDSETLRKIAIGSNLSPQAVEAGRFIKGFDRSSAIDRQTDPVRAMEEVNKARSEQSATKVKKTVAAGKSIMDKTRRTGITKEEVTKFMKKIQCGI